MTTKSMFFSAHLFVILYDPDVENKGFYVQTLACKNLEANVS